VRLAEPRDFHRAAAEVPRPRRRGHHDGTGAVGDEAAVEQAQGLDDVARGQILVERERRAFLRMRRQARMPPERHGDLAELLGPRPVERHVAARGECVQARGAEEAEGRAVTAAVAPHTRCKGRRVAEDAHAHLADARRHRHRRALDHGDGAGTTISGNRAFISGNTHPYRWIRGHRSTTFDANESLGRPVGLCEGRQPPTNPFVFVLAFEVADPGNPPTGGPPALPPPEPLPPCPLACTRSAAVVKPRIAFGKLDTPPGDDVLVFTGRMTVG
jgi:hypothetical protein